MDKKLKAKIAKELHKWAPCIDSNQVIPIGIAYQIAEFIVRIVMKHKAKE